jgi:hypothetical protein
LDRRLGVCKKITSQGDTGEQDIDSGEEDIGNFQSHITVTLTSALPYNCNNCQ